ncbi:hypothetical protein HSX11_03700 [Oxalobacteraceae bacterium]|nr:hypothetical protein [Oxalobacteraceae bacterium]
MSNHDETRHQMIERTVMLRPDHVVDATIGRWEQLAAELSGIVGQGGFQTLYSRSVHLAALRYPWLLPPDQQGFAHLRSSLEEALPALAIEASIALLHIFTDTLALLIGEVLTTSILRSAWGDDIDIAGKEIQ